MRYRSKPTECEALQWTSFDRSMPWTHGANHIVNWVNENGGEARHEPSEADDLPGVAPWLKSRIAVRTINGWAYAVPGHYIVKGTAEFLPTVVDGKRTHPDRSPLIRDFYPCIPETFERRWEPADDYSYPRVRL